MNPFVGYKVDGKYDVFYYYEKIEMILLHNKLNFNFVQIDKKKGLIPIMNQKFKKINSNFRDRSITFGCNLFFTVVIGNIIKKDKESDENTPLKCEVFVYNNG